MAALPRITFGIIVLNGEPFTRYNLRALYPFAAQIIVVEGASPHAASSATPDGHSVDGTLAVLRRFQQEEDPEGKLLVVTAEDEGHPNGFWPGEKDEMSRAYAARATGDWLWQIDIDEFYQPAEMARVCAMLANNPALATVSFRTLTFWGGLTYHVDGWFLRHRREEQFHRLFRWGPGYTYATHRPPTVLDPQGVNLRKLGWKQGYDLAREEGIFLYHYSLVFPFQVQRKGDYYSSYFKRSPDWAASTYMTLARPFRVHAVHRYPSWLDQYRGSHPPAVLAMWEDVRAGVFPHIQIRQTSDVDQLLASPRYRLGRLGLKLSGHVIYGLRRSALRAFRKLPPPTQQFLKHHVPVLHRLATAT
ncbi:MAG: glycosyltransferase family A protein [Chloroflexi bacterium OHK40]